MTQTADTVRVIGRVLSFCTLVRLAIVVGVVVVDERGQEACCAGMRKGVGGRGFKIAVEGLPFLKKGGGRCHILLRICKEDVVIIVVVEDIDNSVGSGFGILTGRDFA